MELTEFKALQGIFPIRRLYQTKESRTFVFISICAASDSGGMEFKMSDYRWLKKYSCYDKDYEKNRGKYKHKFTPLSIEEVIRQEKRLGDKFPAELREFYIQIGFGILGVNNDDFLNLVMSPSDVVDFVLGEGMFENNYCRQDVNLQTKMVFFDTGDSVYLCLDLEKKDDEGKCPVVYSSGIEYVYMAESLEEFLRKMDESPNYYDDLW